MRYLLIGFCLFVLGCRQRAVRVPGRVHDLFKGIVYVTLPKEFVEDTNFTWLILDYDEAFFQKHFWTTDTSMIVFASGYPIDSLPKTFHFGQRAMKKLWAEGMKLVDTTFESSDSLLLVSVRGMDFYKGLYYCEAYVRVFTPHIVCILEINSRGMIDTARFWKMASDISHSAHVVPGNWKFRRGGEGSETSVLIGGHAYGSGAPEK